MEPLWEGRKKVYINGPGHMTKMVILPIYGKNLQKSSPTELKVLRSWSNMYLSFTKFMVESQTPMREVGVSILTQVAVLYP